MNRYDRIRKLLDEAQKCGAIIQWTAYSPDGKKRWSVTGVGAGQRVFTTREVEAFLEGFILTSRLLG